MISAPKVIASTLSVCFFSWSHILIRPTQAQLTSLDSTTVQYVPPSIEDRGRPDGRQGGAASRSSCFVTKENEANLTALVPAVWVSLENTEGYTDAISDSLGLSGYEAIFSLTTETHPSFWFYVPDISNEDLRLEFVFQNEQGLTLYQREFIGSNGTGGIVEVTLPETLPGLTLGESYQWYFITHCNSAVMASRAPYVKGWIARTELDSMAQAQLASTSGLNQASIYADNSVWHDTLAALSELRQQDPENVAAQDAWANLLNSVGLEAISEKPIIDCCTPLN